MCVLCAIPGMVLLFTLARQTREFLLETQCTPETLSLCLPKTLLSVAPAISFAVRLALLAFAFLFVIASLHPSYCLCVSLPFSLCLSLPCFPFVAVFLSITLSLPLCVCLSKRQISSLGETLEDSPSVYK